MFNRWFQGRYGVDQLSRALIIASLIVSVISWFFGRAPAGVYYALRGITLALIAFALFRMLSRNFYARQQELARYMNMERSVRNWWQTLRIRRQNFVNVQKEKKKYKYLTCPQCMQKLRVPKGKGRIRVTCSKCGGSGYTYSTYSVNPDNGKANTMRLSCSSCTSGMAKCSSCHGSGKQ